MLTTGVGSRPTPALFFGPANVADWLPTGRGPGSQAVAGGHCAFATVGARQVENSVIATALRQDAYRGQLHLLSRFIGSLSFVTLPPDALEELHDI